MINARWRYFSPISSKNKNLLWIYHAPSPIAFQSEAAALLRFYWDKSNQHSEWRKKSIFPQRLTLVSVLSRVASLGGVTEIVRVVIIVDGSVVIIWASISFPMTIAIAIHQLHFSIDMSIEIAARRFYDRECATESTTSSLTSLMIYSKLFASP